MCGAVGYRDGYEKVLLVRSSHPNNGDKVKKMKQFKMTSTDTEMYQVLRDYRAGREQCSLRAVGAVGKASLKSNI